MPWDFFGLSALIDPGSSTSHSGSTLLGTGSSACKTQRWPSRLSFQIEQVLVAWNRDLFVRAELFFCAGHHHNHVHELRWNHYPTASSDGATGNAPLAVPPTSADHVVAIKDGFWAHHSDSDSGPSIATEQSGNADATDANAVDTADLPAANATSSANPSVPSHTDGTTAIGGGDSADPAPAADADAGLSDNGNVVPARDGYWPVNDGGAGGAGSPANAETSSAVSAAAMQPATETAAVDNGNVVPVSDVSSIFSAAPDATNATGGLNDGRFVSDGGATAASFSDAHPGSPDGADPVAGHGASAAAGAAGHAQPSPPPPPELPVVTVIASAAMTFLSLSILSRVLSCGKPGDTEPAAAVVIEA
jgi:hypothetical protein